MTWDMDMDKANMTVMISHLNEWQTSYWEFLLEWGGTKTQ